MHIDQRQKIEVHEKFTSERAKWDDSYRALDYPALGLQWRQANGIALCEKTVAPGGRVLDVGCGCGHASVELARVGYRVLGADISDAMIGQARQNAAAAGLDDGIRFAVADFADLGQEEIGTFDGILALGFIEYFDDPIEVLRGFHGLLSEEGTAVIQFWNPRSLAALWVDPTLLRLRSLIHPVQTVRRHWGRSGDRRSRGSENTRGDDSAVDAGGVVHRRYTPADAYRLAEAAGLRPVASAGSLFLSNRTPLSDACKARLEGALQSMAVRSDLLRSYATDYIIAFQK